MRDAEWEGGRRGRGHQTESSEVGLPDCAQPFPSVWGSELNVLCVVLSARVWFMYMCSSTAGFMMKELLGNS